MALTHLVRTSTGCALGLALALAAGAAASGQQAPEPLAVGSARVTINGTSNIHPYTASTDVVRVTSVRFASAVAGPTFWEEVVKPGALEAFEVSIPAAKLSSPKDGLDKNMHKALKVQQHPDITFRLVRLEARESAGALRAVGVLRVAGVEREIVMNITTARTDAGLAVKGEVPLLMTDFGIAPPKAMLGMLKTDPKVTVTFETVLTVPLT